MIPRRYGRSFTLIDSLGEIKRDPAETPEAYDPVIRTLGHAAKVTETALDVIHHNRREPAGSKGHGALGDRIRGPATFKNRSRFALALDVYRGKRRIHWAKVSYDVRPPDDYFIFDDNGLPRESDAPAEATSALDQALLPVMRDAGATVTVAVLWNALPTRGRPSVDTVRRWLKDKRDMGQIRLAGRVPGKGGAQLFELADGQAHARLANGAMQTDLHVGGQRDK